MVSASLVLLLILLFKMVPKPRTEVLSVFLSAGSL